MPERVTNAGGLAAEGDPATSTKMIAVVPAATHLRHVIPKRAFAASLLAAIEPLSAVRRWRLSHRTRPITIKPLTWNQNVKG